MTLTTVVKPHMALLVLSVLALCPLFTLAEHGSVEFTVDKESFGPFEEFGYDAGGTIDLTATFAASAASQTPVTFMVCSLTTLHNVRHACQTAAVWFVATWDTTRVDC